MFEGDSADTCTGKLGAERRVQHAQTREQGSPSALAEINFIFFAAGGTIYVDIKFNFKNINKVDVSFYKAKYTFGVTVYKEKVFFI